MAKAFSWVSKYGIVGILFVLIMLYLRGQQTARWAKKEGFSSWPGVGVRAQPPIYAAAKENFVSKKCPDGTRSDGPCLMEFPGF